MESNIRIGVIGVGGVGELLLSEFLTHPKTDLIGIYDANPSRMKAIGEKYQVPIFHHIMHLIDDERTISGAELNDGMA